MHLSPCRLWKLRLYETREQNLLLGQPGNWFDSINNALSFQRLLGRLILPRSFLCHWWSCLDLLEREGRRDSGSRLRFGGCRETSSRSRAVARGRAFPSAATTPPVDTQLQISVVYLFDFFWEKTRKKQNNNFEFRVVHVWSTTNLVADSIWLEFFVLLFDFVSRSPPSDSESVELIKLAWQQIKTTLYNFDKTIMSRRKQSHPKPVKRKSLNFCNLFIIFPRTKMSTCCLYECVD